MFFMTLRILLETTSAKRRTFRVDGFKNNKDVPWGFAGHSTDNLGSGALFRKDVLHETLTSSNCLMVT
jgi:hypothetical protein